MIKKIKMRLQITKESGLFHDTRRDVRILCQCINKLEDKINELIEANNELQEKLKNKE